MPVKRKCKEPLCRKYAPKRSARCYACDKRIWRKKYPMKACFNTLRHNATRRGKEFTLTFADFEKFCYETNYMAGKGRSSQSFTIDREDNTKGYTPDNIRMITKAENTRKLNKVLMYDWETKTARVV